MKHKKWTEAEDNILRDNYPDLGFAGVAKLLPDRTEEACRVRARKLHIAQKTKWSPEEIEILKRDYPTLGAKGVSMILGKRTAKACRVRAFLEGVSSHRYTWAQDEDDIFYEKYSKYGPQGVLDAINRKLEENKERGIEKWKVHERSGTACRVHAHKLEITRYRRRGRKWSTEEDEILKTYYPNMGKEVSKKLKGRSILEIYNRARALGLKRIYPLKIIKPNDEI